MLITFSPVVYLQTCNTNRKQVFAVKLQKRNIEIMIKARIFRVFKDNRHNVDYTFVSPAKYHDDVESVSNDEFITPMMEIRLLKEDNTFEKNSISVWASPDVVRAYTGFEIFNQDYNYSFEGRILDIEFEWIEGVYPYSKLYDSSESLAINVEHSPIEWYER